MSHTMRTARRTLPLVTIDPGWPFLLAGLALCAAAALLPNERELDEMRRRLEVVRLDEDAYRRRIVAYGALLDGVMDPTDLLVAELAAAQLNLIPEDHEPVMRPLRPSLPVADWALDGLPVPGTSELPPPAPPSLLEALVLGGSRLWVIGAGAMSVFLGLVLAATPAGAASSSEPGGAARTGEAADDDETDTDADDEPAGPVEPLAAIGQEPTRGSAKAAMPARVVEIETGVEAAPPEIVEYDADDQGLLFGGGRSFGDSR